MTTRDGERRVNGLWCGEVLRHLPELVEGALDPATRAAVEGHVAGCDWCERFGGAYAGVATRLRRALEAEVPAQVAERLAARLVEELG